MGYLIGGAGEGPDKEITASSDNPFAKLSDSDLIRLRDQTEKDVAKFNNFQMARKITELAYVQSVISISVITNLPCEAITLSGQVSIRWIENKVNGYLNSLLQTEDVDYVIASDTDSIYLNFGPLVDKFFSKYAKD